MQTFIALISSILTIIFIAVAVYTYMGVEKKYKKIFDLLNASEKSENKNEKKLPMK